MKVSLAGNRPVVGGLVEFVVRLDDADTGRFFLLGPGRASSMPLVRAKVCDPHRPASSVAPGFEDIVELRGRAVYVNRPMPGYQIAVAVKLSLADFPLKDSVRVSAQSMTVIERVGELAQDIDLDA